MTAPRVQDLVERLHDAELDADAWKKTASRWRKRAMREGGAWRIRCARLEAELDVANERGAQLAEERSELKEELKDRLSKESSEKLQAQLKAAMNDARMTDYHRKQRESAEKASLDTAANARRKVEEAKHREAKAYAESVGTLNALRVVAMRLGVSKGSKEWDDPNMLAGEVDRRVVALLAK